MKKNNIKSYATALTEKILEKPASTEVSAWQRKVIANFVGLLMKEGLLGKSGEILYLAESIILKNQGKKRVIFETARKITESQKKLLESFAKKGDVVSEKINPSLVAGVRITVDGSSQLDSSLSNKLQTIFY